MAKFVSYRKHHETTTYDLMFYTTKHGGYAFPCDEHGNLFPPKNDCAAANMLGCLTGETVTTHTEIIEYTNRWVEPACIVCEDCKQRYVYLHGFTNTCECGADYNMSGGILAPREQWGEETGESLTDILAADMGADCEHDEF
jgi:hypothetical protein